MQLLLEKKSNLAIEILEYYNRWLHRIDGDAEEIQFALEWIRIVLLSKYQKWHMKII